MSESASSHLIRACDLRVRLALSGTGMTLQSVYDGRTRHAFLRGNAPLFRLTLRDTEDPERQTVLSSAEGWETASASVCGSVHTLVFARSGLTVVLTASAEENRLTWTTRLLSTDGQNALIECEYPRLSFTPGRDTRVFFPYGCGEVYRSDRPFTTEQNYPSYGASMEYMALWHEKTGRGLYYGLHDPAPAYKKLRFSYDPAVSPDASLAASMPLVDIDRGCNSQTLAGETVWRLFDGDWYDAALLYRAFFEEKAGWMPVMKDGKRADTPEWLRTNPHWWRKRMDLDDSFADELIKADKALGLSSPSPVHLYDWFQIPYDTNYPHYFPEKDAFVPGMRKLQRYGIRVMPYINGRLWDTHDRGKEDWQFTPLAKPWCTKSAGEKPFLEVYPTSNIELAIMCPSSALWQEKLREIADGLFNRLGVDGIYIDQIGAARAYPCEDRRHRHRPGGGEWWIDSYRDLLGHVHRVTPEGGFLTTECTSDPYMRDIQGYLSWIWVKNDQVPAFMAIYNGYVTVFGRSFDYAGDRIGKNILAAQSLTFGEQMGWIKPEVFAKQKRKDRDFYRKCVLCREAVGSFLYDGRLLRSPRIGDKNRLRTRRILHEAYGGLLAHTATFSELWERKDGKKLLFLINASDKETTSAVSTADLPDGRYPAQGDLSGEVLFRDGKTTVCLPPLSVSWIVC